MSEFAIVGVSELFSETLSLMTSAFGWRPCVVDRKNITGPRPEIPRTVRDRIAELNPWDMDLYRFARRQLEARIAQESGACRSSNN